MPVPLPSELKLGLRELIKGRRTCRPDPPTARSAQGHLLAVVGRRELFADVALFTMAQDVVEPIRLEVQEPVQSSQV